MFIGRKTELMKLEQLYQKDNFECIVVYGRRRIGKTTLINEFIKNKDAVYFMGLETNAKDNLENLSRSIMSLSADFSQAESIFPSFQKALETIFSISMKKRIIMVIDEYPYLAASYKGISSIIQQLIDSSHRDSKLFLILCGSSLSFMENQVLGYKSPLFGRRTAQFKIKPFEFYEIRDYYTRFNIHDLACIYGITGGIPQYMSKIDDMNTLDENIKANFLDPAAYLFEEPINLIKQECREPAQYNAIIRSIAKGASRLSEIANKVGIDTGLCSNYLSSLMSIGIIKKEYPFREESTKKTIYLLEDSMFRFWYRFIPDNMALINKGQADIVYKKIEKQFPSFMGGVFEDICKQYLWNENIAGRLPIEFTDLGRWWGNDPIYKCETEIDILAHSDDSAAIFSECKWTGENVSLDVLNDLEHQAQLFKYKKSYLYLFAKKGFSEAVIKKALVQDNIRLVTLEDIGKSL